MSDTTRTVLLALGFALAGSGGTALGFAIAQRGEPAQSIASAGDDDTSSPRTSQRIAARKARAKALGTRATSSRRGRGQGQGQAMRGRGGSGQGIGQGQGQGRSWGSLAEGIDISSEQQQAWQQMMSDIRTRCVAERLEQGDTTLEMMMNAVSAQDEDTEALHAQVEAGLEARREASHCVLEEVLEFRTQLSPEQRAALAERVGSLRERRQAWLDAWSD
jgi:Spy/CpxP family protein refolding chaperone